MLTPRQLELLKTVKDLTDSNCYSPSITELATEAGISRSTAYEHISELKNKKMLTAIPGKARSLKTTSKALKLLEQLDRQPEAESNGSGIPLLGRVAAGMPIEAVENREYLSLEDQFAVSDDSFALMVKGNSMIGDNIFDGDYVICRRTAAARNGELVVAIIDNENATLKRFFKESDRIRLQPSNEDYEPIYTDNCRIEGVVTGLMRKY